MSAPALNIEAGCLIGWEQLNQWAYYNDVIWNRSAKESQMHKLSEVDSLKLLCATLFNVKETQQKALEEMISNRPIIIHMP